MFADIDTFKQTIRDTPPDRFVCRYLESASPFIFGSNREQWFDWRRKLAEGLGVDAPGLILTGSSALGYSLNPRKGFRAFGASSDIDVAVVSQHHFDIGWRWLRRSRSRDLSLFPDMRTIVEAHRSNYIYWGTIATDKILPLLPFAKPWREALDAMSKIAPTKSREINVRIYCDFGALRGYQINGLRTLQNSLLSGEPELA